MEPRMTTGDVVIVRKQDDAESGDIVIATVNGSDATCKRLKKYENGIVSTLYICFRRKSSMVHNGFFEYVFESNEYYNELEKITQEGNRNHGILNMNINDYFNIKVILPEYGKQEKLYKIFSCLDKKIELEKSKKLQYEKIKTGLMQKLLTGKVRVNI